MKESLLEQFRIFCSNNSFKTLEDSLMYFSVFSGFKEKIDTSKPLNVLIEELIFKDYRYILKGINDLTTGDNLFHFVLSGGALGDSQTHTAFKRAKVSANDGEAIVKELVKLGVISLSYPISINNQKNDVSAKINFKSPFIRFWFAFVSPLYQGIKNGDFTEVKKSLSNKLDEFIAFNFKQLSRDLIAEKFSEYIVKVGSYWNGEIELDIVGVTKENEYIVGECKFANSKIKKSVVTNILEKSQKLSISPKVCIVVAKKGFSSELKSLKGDGLKLFSLKHLA